MNYVHVLQHYSDNFTLIVFGDEGRIQIINTIILTLQPCFLHLTYTFIVHC